MGWDWWRAAILSSDWSRDGAKLYELRRGIKRTASIFSLSFSPCGTFLACSSNTETVHVFKLDESSHARWVSGEQCEQLNIASDNN